MQLLSKIVTGSAQKYRFFFIKKVVSLLCLSNKSLFEEQDIFSLQFDTTPHWDQINIFIIANKYLVDTSLQKFNIPIYIN